MRFAVLVLLISLVGCSRTHPMQRRRGRSRATNTYLRFLSRKTARAVIRPQRRIKPAPHRTIAY